MSATETFHRTFVDRRDRPERRADRLRRIAEAHYFSATMDRLPQPILLLAPGSPMRVWYCNAAARALLTGTAFSLCGELLVIANAAESRAFRRAVRAAYDLQDARARQLTLGALADGQPSLILSVTLIDAPPDIAAIVPRLLLIDLEEKPSQESASLRLRRDFRLTPAEAEVAIGLYAAGSVDALARQASKSVHTVRTQLKAAMNKTATRTQAGLVALVGGRLQD